MKQTLHIPHRENSTQNANLRTFRLPYSLAILLMQMRSIRLKGFGGLRCLDSQDFAKVLV
jgi:hypothetical protein